MPAHGSNSFMLRAIELAQIGMDSNRGGPFGAVVVKNGKIIGEGYNAVTSTHDPTAHAEIVAIREACKSLKTFHLSNCEIYCSCEPCPMCLGAIYWAQIEKIYFALNRKQAASCGFSDDFIYNELSLDPSQRKIQALRMMEVEGVRLFQKWQEKSDKTLY